MPRAKPSFADRRRWYLRASKAYPAIDRRIWYDPDDGYEYERDPTPEKGTWHRIDWRRRMYQEIDADTDERVSGGEGEWRRHR